MTNIHRAINPIHRHMSAGLNFIALVVRLIRLKHNLEGWLGMMMGLLMLCLHLLDRLVVTISGVRRLRVGSWI